MADQPSDMQQTEDHEIDQGQEEGDVMRQQQSGKSECESQPSFLTAIEERIRGLKDERDKDTSQGFADGSAVVQIAPAVGAEEIQSCGQHIRKPVLPDHGLCTAVHCPGTCKEDQIAEQTIGIHHGHAVHTEPCGNG